LWLFLGRKYLRKEKNKVKIVFIGSVLSSYRALQSIFKMRSEYATDIVGVFGLDETFSKKVSDYYPIHKYAEKIGIPSFTFRNINNEDTIKKIKKLNPDLIFVIGLSQIISKEILEIPQIGCIGFHPTPLPKMRGRAAIPWMILLGVRESAATLFFLDENVDSGDIIDQVKYVIEENDYAIDVYNKVCIALETLIERNFPLLINGKISRIPQNEKESTYLSKRVPSDGLINWNNSSDSILRLIRAVSKPYPGAYSFYEGRKVIIWKASSLDLKEKYIGLPGQIVDIVNGNLYVATGAGLLSIESYEIVGNFCRINIGHKFGVNLTEEIMSLKKRVSLLESELSKWR
jgi:methionyl-tRNA formyltransferase